MLPSVSRLSASCLRQESACKTIILRSASPCLTVEAQYGNKIDGGASASCIAHACLVILVSHAVNAHDNIDVLNI